MILKQNSMNIFIQIQSHKFHIFFQISINILIHSTANHRMKNIFDKGATHEAEMSLSFKRHILSLSILTHSALSNKLEKGSKR